MTVTCTRYRSGSEKTSPAPISRQCAISVKRCAKFRDSSFRREFENYSRGQYYLASFANKIWLSPQGQVRSSRLRYEWPVLQNAAG